MNSCNFSYRCCSVKKMLTLISLRHLYRSDNDCKRVMEFLRLFPFILTRVSYTAGPCRGAVLRV